MSPYSGIAEFRQATAAKPENAVSDSLCGSAPASRNEAKGGCAERQAGGCCRRCRKLPRALRFLYMVFRWFLRVRDGRVSGGDVG